MSSVEDVIRTRAKAIISTPDIMPKVIMSASAFEAGGVTSERSASTLRAESVGTGVGCAVGGLVG